MGIHALMEDKPLSPKWFIQAMALLAVAGMTIPLVAGVAGFIKDEIMRPGQTEKTER
jgi:fructose-specific phosphotransferase system IIC component